MTEFYDILTAIKSVLEVQPFVNTVTTGGIEDVDLNKQTIFPLSHIIVNSAIPKSNTIQFNISVLAMDIVDESKDKTNDVFVGNDNEQDVLNQQLQVLNQLYQQMRHGDLFSSLVQLEENPSCEPFVDRFENKLAGWTMTFDVEVPNDMTICGVNTPTSTCLDARYTLLNSSEFIIDSGHIASGQHENINVPDTNISNSDGSFTENIPSCESYSIPDTQIILKDHSGNVLSTNDFPSCESYDLEAPSADIFLKKSSGADILNLTLLSGSSTNQTISDSVITLKDTNDVIISTTNVQATDTANITAPDGVVTVKKSDGTTIQTQSVKSNGTANSTVSDSVITIRKSDNVLISTDNVKATDSLNKVISDSAITLKDTSGTTISTTNVKATDSANITAPNSTIQINNRTFGTAKSNETKNFNFTTAQLMATGQTTSYGTGDDGNIQAGRNFFTLLENNPFGNTNRFTALNGSQTYSNDIVIDWSTWNGQTVLGWYRVPQGTAITWDNARIGANAFSILSFTSGWRLPNARELIYISWFGSIDMLNFAPFNLINRLLWTGTTALSNPANAYRTPSTGFLTNGSKTATNLTQCYIPCRYFTNAELGI